MGDNARVQFQRDFYHLLLNLQTEPRSLRENLREALELVQAISDAERAYLEVRDAGGECVYQAISIPDDEIAGIQAAVSTGIIAETVRTGKPILVPSALIDARFNKRESVQRLAIESVLCVPVFGENTHGVLYLQGDRGFKEEAEKIRLDTELFSKHVGPLLDRLLIEQERTREPNTVDTLRTHYKLDSVLGNSDALYEVLKVAMMVAPLDVTTLLLGETGTGKTQLARLMHDNSHRRDAPFMEINCAALPESLIENELFGAVRGGHSTATHPVTGKITAADGGTLFLDEIGALPLEAQAKLLQFIQSGQYYPLGSSEIKASDARLIFATNEDLRSRIADGRFREDLYFRINTFEITMPSLAERRPDIPLIAKGFLDQCVRKHQFPNMQFSDAARDALMAIRFEGNVRGLQSLVERACINARFADSNTIAPEHLPAANSGAPSEDSADFHAATQSFQRKMLVEKLEQTGWNISQAARELNLSRSHVHSLINTFNLERDP